MRARGVRMDTEVRGGSMLILEDILMAKHCFKEAEIIISSTIQGKRFTVQVPASFYKGIFDDAMLNRIRNEVEKYCRANCEHELQYIEQLIEFINKR